MSIAAICFVNQYATPLFKIWIAKRKTFWKYCLRSKNHYVLRLFRYGELKWTIPFNCFKTRGNNFGLCLIPPSVIYNNFSSNWIYSQPTEYNIVTLVRNTPEWNYGNGIKNGYGSNVDICEHIKNTPLPMYNIKYVITYISIVSLDWGLVGKVWFFVVIRLWNY